MTVGPKRRKIKGKANCIMGNLKVANLQCTLKWTLTQFCQSLFMKLALAKTIIVILLKEEYAYALSYFTLVANFSQSGGQLHR